MPTWITEATGLDPATGMNIARALITLVAWLLVIRGAHWLVMRYLGERIRKHRPLVILVNVIYLLLVIQAIVLAIHKLGFEIAMLNKLALIGVAVIGALVIILRPLFPSMPFKIGNTVMVGGQLGKVEAMNAMYTRMRTFDGKTLFVPHTAVLKDTLVNYHFTPNRRIEVDVAINYEDDLARAKEIILEEMNADERTLDQPAPRVYVLGLDENFVRLGGRCWVPNLKYWKTRSDLLERVKLRFDAEPGVSFAVTRRRVSLEGGHSAEAAPKAG